MKNSSDNIQNILIKIIKMIFQGDNITYSMATESDM